MQFKREIELTSSVLSFYCLTALLTFSIRSRYMFFFSVSCDARFFFLFISSKNDQPCWSYRVWLLLLLFCFVLVAFSFFAFVANVIMSKNFWSKICVLRMSHWSKMFLVSAERKKTINKKEEDEKNVGKNSDNFLLLQLLFITSSNHIPFFHSFHCVECMRVLFASCSLECECFLFFFFPLLLLLLKRRKWSQSNESHHKTARSQKLTRKLEANVLILHFVSQLLANPNSQQKAIEFLSNFCSLDFSICLSLFFVLYFLFGRLSSSYHGFICFC